MKSVLASMLGLPLAVSACAALLDTADVTYTDAGDAGGPPDASADVPGDRGPEGDAGDAGVADADADAGPNACGHTFCESFDDDAGVQLARWNGLPVSKNDALLEFGVDDAGATTPPNAFWFSTPNLTFTSSVFLAKTLSAQNQGITCDFDLAVPTAPTGCQTDLFELEVLPSQTSAYGAGLTLFPDGKTILFEASGTTATATKSGPDLYVDGRWNHLTVEIRTTTSPPAFIVTTTGAVPLTLGNFPSGVAGYDARFGLLAIVRASASGSVPLGVRYDTITCDVK